MSVRHQVRRVPIRIGSGRLVPLARPKRAAHGLAVERQLVVNLLVLLACGVLLDHLTGPLITAAAFYVFPVALAGLRGGPRAWVPTALLATALNTGSEWSGRNPAIQTPGLITNEVLHLLVFLGVGWLSSLLGQEQRALEEQRNELAAQRDILAGLNERMDRELQDTRVLQQILMQPPPEHPALDLAIRMQPARTLGGDAALVTLTPHGRLAITIADVAGKGAPAALAGAVLLGMLDRAPGRHVSPAQTLAYLNDRLAERLPDEAFVTMFYGLLDLDTGELVYASAGHEEPFLFHSGGVELLPPTGIILGGLPQMTFEERRVQLRPGDLLFCYTDGASDALLPSGERIGGSRFRQRVREHRGKPAERLLDSLVEGLYSEADRVADDVTLIAGAVSGLRR